MSLNYVRPGEVTTSTGYTAGVDVVQPTDLQGGVFANQLHAPYYASTRGENVYHFGVTAVTIPLMAANMSSVCSLYNPLASGKLLELLYVDIGIVLATTVVNTVGLYYEKFTSAPTYTAAAAINGRIGSTTANMVGVPCSAVTHVAMGATSAATARVAIIHTFGATSTTNATPIHKDFQGILVPPGVVVSVANSTAASTASSAGIHLCWQEWDL